MLIVKFCQFEEAGGVAATLDCSKVAQKLSKGVKIVGWKKQYKKTDL